MEASGDGPLDREEYRKWLETMERNKVSWVNWSISDKDETCSMLLSGTQSIGSWQTGVIKPWGQLVRNTLRQYTP